MTPFDWLTPKTQTYFNCEQIFVNCVRKLQIFVTIETGVGLTQSKLS